MATSPVSATQTSNFASMLPVPAWMPARQKRSSPATTAAIATATGMATSAASVPITLVSSIASAAHPASMTREQVLLEHLPLVRFVAHRIHERLPQHVEMEDLVHAGVVGLIDAFNKFDHEKNVQFRTYAQFRIRGAILDSLRMLDWGPRELRRKARTIEDATQTLIHRLSRRPQESEVADELGMALAPYQELLSAVKGLEIGSLHEVHTENSAEEELVYIETNPEDDPLHRYMRSEQAAHLSAAVAELPDREQRILQMYYVEEMTLKQIGVVLGVVESRVSQIRVAAIRQLRTLLAFSGKHPEKTAPTCLEVKSA